jgi:hypothetical protein
VRTGNGSRAATEIERGSGAASAAEFVVYLIMMIDILSLLG